MTTAEFSKKKGGTRFPLLESFHQCTHSVGKASSCQMEKNKYYTRVRLL